MAISDFELEHLIKSGRLVIQPFAEGTIRENGIDFRITSEVARHKPHGADFIFDPHDETHTLETYAITNEDRIVIGPNEQVLLSTMEYVELPDDIMGMVELRSTWARHGFSIPPTIIDAGFKGTITLEVVNNAPYSIALRPKERFAHTIFFKTSSRVENAYKGNYMGQRGIKLPKLLGSDNFV